MNIFKYYSFVIVQALITACICGRGTYSGDDKIRALHSVWTRNSPAWSWRCKDLINRGDTLYSFGAYDEALIFYNKAVEKKPNEPSFYRLRGLCYRGNFNYDDALTEFQTAISVARKNKFTEEEELRVLDEFELSDLGKSLLDTGTTNSDGVIWCFTEALKRNPSASNYSMRGNCYTKYKIHWDKAMSDFKITKKLEPTVHYVEISYLIQMLLDQRRLDETTLDDLAFILDDVEFEKIADQFQNIHQRFNEAILLYNEAIKKSSRDADYFRKRGSCHFNMGNWDEAEKDFQENLRLDPKDEKGREYLIKTLFSSGKCDDALKLAQTLTDVELSSIGRYYEGRKQFEAAINFYTEALKKKPSAKMYYLDLSRCHKGTKDFDAMITDVKAVLKIDPNDQNRWTDLIELSHDSGRKSEIKDEIMKMDYSRILDLGRRFFKFKDYQKAIFCYDIAIKKDPKKPDGYENRAECYRALGQPDEELTNLEDFINLSPRPSKAALLKRAEALVAVEKLDEAKVALKNLKTKMVLDNYESQRVEMAFQKIKKIEFENTNG